MCDFIAGNPISFAKEGGISKTLGVPLEMVGTRVVLDTIFSCHCVDPGMGVEIFFEKREAIE